MILSGSPQRAVTMMIGRSRVRGWARRRRISDRPDWPGKVQSSSSMSGRLVLQHQQGALGVGRAADDMARHAQIEGDQFLDRGGVFNDKDMGGWHGESV
jgi:hypothetical protein